MAETERPSYWLPVEHSMQRRNQRNSYHAGHKAYMVTLRIQDMVPLLGRVEASTDPAQVAQCRLTALGEAMRQAWLSLPQRFPNITIKDSADEYVIMPEHFHGIIYVTGRMQEHLSEVVRLFKARVAMSYRWLLIQGADASGGDVGGGDAGGGDAGGGDAAGGDAGGGDAGGPVSPIIPVGMAKEWLMAYQALPALQQAEVRRWVGAQLALLYSATRCGTQLRNGTQGQDGPQGQDGTQAQPAPQVLSTPSPIRVTSSGRHVKTGFLFGIGYTDSLLLDEENLEGHRLYIRNNPRSRWMRSHNRRLLRANRDGINTAVTIPALEGYLGSVCPRQDVSEEKLAAIRSLLLLDVCAGRNESQPNGGSTLGAGRNESQPNGGGTPGAGRNESQPNGGSVLCAGRNEAQPNGGSTPGAGRNEAQPNGGSSTPGAGRYIICHSYGDRDLLKATLLPVVCHRKDAPIYEQQKACCLRAAASGAVLVSACISPKEREIMHAAMDAGYPVVHIVDNGFPEIYHPSQDDIDLCAAGKLLLLTPWQYHYRRKDEAIYVAYCKTMNCIAQAICRKKDEWWKQAVGTPHGGVNG